MLPAKAMGLDEVRATFRPRHLIKLSRARAGIVCAVCGGDMNIAYAAVHGDITRGLDFASGGIVFDAVGPQGVIAENDFHVTTKGVHVSLFFQLFKAGVDRLAFRRAERNF
jgi:hypothetical protein